VDHKYIYYLTPLYFGLPSTLTDTTLYYSYGIAEERLQERNV